MARVCHCQRAMGTGNFEKRAADIDWLILVAMMSNEARYFEVLSGAVAQIEEDAFEARGAIYDRLWAIVVERLQADGDDTDEALASERAAFLAAVKRIEFGERVVTSSEDAEAAWRESPTPWQESQAPWQEPPSPALEPQTPV